MTDIIIIIVSALAAVGGFFWRRSASAKLKAIEKPTKKQKRGRKYATWLIVLGLYIVVVTAIQLIFGKQESKPIEVSIWAARVNFFGLDISETVLNTWCIMAVIIVLAVILRLTVIRKLKDVPKGAQNVLEFAVEWILKYTKSTTHGVGEFLASYLFTVAIFLIGCACVEMFGFRTPASDITVTASLAILTFFFINYYGIKNKGVGGRIKTLASPTPAVFPIRVITDFAVPVSLASRLFGNMLGGLVVMDLLYTALGGYAVGIPSVAGLYFNVFHPLIQAFIFVTLTLTFINEATE
jgi:F-type H+-transporting ATPase subunit a